MDTAILEEGRRLLDLFTRSLDNLAGDTSPDTDRERDYLVSFLGQVEVELPHNPTYEDVERALREWVGSGGVRKEVRYE